MPSDFFLSSSYWLSYRMFKNYCWRSANWYYLICHRVYKGEVKNWTYLRLFISDLNRWDLANQLAFYHNMDKTPRENWLYCVRTLYNKPFLISRIIENLWIVFDAFTLIFYSKCITIKLSSQSFHSVWNIKKSL